MTRYYDHDSGRYIECEIFASGADVLTDPTGWRQRHESQLLQMAPGSKDWITESEAKAVEVEGGQRPKRHVRHGPIATTKACACGEVKWHTSEMCKECRKKAREPRLSAGRCACGRVRRRARRRCGRCEDTDRKAGRAA